MRRHVAALLVMSAAPVVPGQKADLLRALFDGSVPEPTIAERVVLAGARIEVPVDDGAFMVVSRATADDRLLVERLPRGPFLFQLLFFPRSGDPQLIVSGDATKTAAQLLDRMSPAEFGATLERLRALPQEGELAPFLRALKSHHAQAAAQCWLLRADLDSRPQPVSRAFVAYFAAQTPVTRAELRNTLSSADLAELALALVGDAGDEAAFAQIAESVEAWLMAYGLADYPQPARPRTQPGAAPAETQPENFGVAQFNAWSRIKATALPATAERLRARHQLTDREIDSWMATVNSSGAALADREAAEVALSNADYRLVVPKLLGQRPALPSGPPWNSGGREIDRRAPFEWQRFYMFDRIWRAILMSPLPARSPEKGLFLVELLKKSPEVYFPELSEPLSWHWVAEAEAPLLQLAQGANQPELAFDAAVVLSWRADVDRYFDLALALVPRLPEHRRPSAFDRLITLPSLSTLEPARRAELVREAIGLLERDAAPADLPELALMAGHLGVLLKVFDRPPITTGATQEDFAAGARRTIEMVSSWYKAHP